jgi:hypothetical protein
VSSQILQCYLAEGGIINSFPFSVGAQAVTPTYVSAYALVEQISELADELHYYQHELENVLPREHGRFIDEQ